MDPILELARRRGLAVVEDNAHGLFARYRGRPLGSLGDLGALSFHQTKNITCGEGGALVLGDRAMLGRAEVLLEKGTDRASFFRGEVDSYNWVDVGSSFLPSDLLSALLYAQLEARDRITRLRQQVWELYHRECQLFAARWGVRLPEVPAHCQTSHHVYYCLLEAPERRADLIRFLAGKGIEASFHYQPLHLSPMGRKLGGKAGDCPVTERVARSILRLPCHARLTGEEQGRTLEALDKFLGAE
jgi:dTDP-4-amino-4,6-dideoxygalactose transaminase